MSPGFWGVAKTSEAELASACLGLKIFARKLGCAGTKSRVDESRLDEERPLEEVLALKQAYRILFRSKRVLKEALAEVRQDMGSWPRVVEFVEFVEGCERGVTRP